MPSSDRPQRRAEEGWAQTHARPHRSVGLMELTSDPFHFAVSVAPGPDTLITVTGDLDLATTPAFEAAIADIDLGSVRHAVLDLERLDFMDAIGLRAVLALNSKCDSASATLTIRPGPRPVQRVFELTGFGRELTFTGTG